MKQERLIRTRERVNEVMARAKAIKAVSPAVITQWQAKAPEQVIYEHRPLLYALDKAIEKPVRMDGSRARCPDCGTGIRIKTDNYCFRCGQRLRPIEKDKKPRFTGNKHKRDRKNGR